MIDYLQLIHDKMLAADKYSQQLGMNLIDASAGNAVVIVVVTEEMCNGFGIAHGGIAYSLADSAAAFAANTKDGIAITISNAVQYHYPVRAKDRLVAKATEVSRSRDVGQYRVTVHVGERLVLTLQSTLRIKMSQ